MKPAVASPAGSKISSCPLLVVTAAISVGADREVLDRRPQFVFPDPAARRSQSADPIALLDQSQAELVGLDGEMSELDQADIETVERVSPEVAEDDLAVGRRGQPAGRRPDDPADAGHVGPLSQFLAGSAIQAEGDAGW